MIRFKYFGHALCPRRQYGCPCNRQSIWAHFTEETIDSHGYIEIKHYTLWGSPNKPIIRSVYRNSLLHEKLMEMRGSTKYTFYKHEDVLLNFPNTVSEVGQFLVMRKLKNV